MGRDKKTISIILGLIIVIGFAGNGYSYQFGDMGIPDNYDSLIVKNFDQMGSYPSSFNWMDLGVVTPAKDQGSCGSCWAFATVGALESKILIRGGKINDFSEQQLVSCNPYGYNCIDGGTMLAIRFFEANDVMRENGVGGTGYCACDAPCSNYAISYTLPFESMNYYTVNTTSITDMQASIYSDGPAYFRFDVYADFLTYWNNGAPGEVYTNTGSSTWEGGHAVLIVGWDDDLSAWICKNSWGANNGPNGDGTFLIAYHNLHNYNLSFGMANFTITADKAPLNVHWNGEDTDHMYTTTYSPYWYASIGYPMEGESCKVDLISKSNNVPVYEYYNDVLKDHFYTTIDTPAAMGYVKKGLAYYIEPTQNGSTVPYYGYWNGTDHYYTTVNVPAFYDYINEGVLGYVDQ